MTADEWEACNCPSTMLKFLRGTASDRKARLFGVACCRRISHLLGDERSRRAVAVAEAFADGEVSEHDRHKAAVEAQDARKSFRNDNWSVFRAAVAAEEVLDIPEEADDGYGWDAAASATPDEYGECDHQAVLFRDIFGNPFRPVAFDPAWRTSTAVALAEGIYTDRAFDRLPILADALQDAGCEDADVLSHCRGPGPHARGCWVVDLVLGKA